MIGKWHIRARYWIAVGLLIGCGAAEEESLGERLERYQREVAEDPSDPEAHYELGRVYYEQTRYAQALQVFRRARLWTPPTSVRRSVSARCCWCGVN